ncbi:hypothetical protein DEJ45_04585 [Streptomyces venezuelae]|nr:hypothetical protein DEJ45_04585 [Streptomyces venezuelae]
MTMVGLMPGSVQADSGNATVQTNLKSSGLHTYNPNAPVGSADNPAILDGQDQAVLSPQQVKELMAAKKVRLEQARTGQVSRIAAGCIIGAYWSTCKQYQGFGQINLATELRSGHEYIRQQGWLYGGGSWETYMDVSTNNGASWEGWQSLMINDSSWGAYVNDTSPRIARGCLYNSVTHYVGCTGWH